MTTTIVDWLRHAREPADLYELLDERRFEPSRQRLLAAVRTRYGELLPYENHEDPNLAGKATELLRRLAEADGMLRDRSRLRAHHRAILESLRRDYAQFQGQRLPPPELAEWLRRQSVHPDRIERVAFMLGSGSEDPESLTLDAAMRFGAPPSEGHSAEFCLDEFEPSHHELHDMPPLQVLRDGTGDRRPGGPLPIDGGLAPGEHVDAAEKAGVPEPRGLPGIRDRRNGARWGWIVLAGVVGLSVLAILAAVRSGSKDMWRGILLQVRGYAGEVHLLVQLDRDAQVEAMTRDSRLIRALEECWDAKEIQELHSAEGVSPEVADLAGASVIAIRGRAASAASAAFRLAPRGDVPLVEMRSLERIGELGPRGGSGARQPDRGAGRAPARRTELARLLRIHPQAGTRVGFPARYIGAVAQRITVSPGVNDRRSVVIEFPGTSPGAFVNYRNGDSVFVQAEVSSQTNAVRVALRGVEIRRLAEPASRVAAKEDP